MDSSVAQMWVAQRSQRVPGCDGHGFTFRAGCLGRLSETSFGRTLHGKRKCDGGEEGSRRTKLPITPRGWFTFKVDQTVAVQVDVPQDVLHFLQTHLRQNSWEMVGLEKYLKTDISLTES